MAVNVILCNFLLTFNRHVSYLCYSILQTARWGTIFARGIGFVTGLCVSKIACIQNIKASYFVKSVVKYSKV